jgi:hypothetical protein
VPRAPVLQSVVVLFHEDTRMSPAGGEAIGVVHEGVYGLSFTATQADGAERVEGLAVLRGGRVLGSDPHGGVFTGRYHYDTACGEAVIAVRLAIPPGGVLLTGLEAGPDGLLIDISGRFAPARPVSSAVVDVAGAPIAVELRFVGPLSA